MRFPKTKPLGMIRTPSLPRLSLVSISSVAGTACTVAFWVLTVGAVLIPAAVIGLKLLTPDAMLTAGEGEEAIQFSLPWAYVLLVATAAFASVTLGVWIGQFLVARFVRGAMEAPSPFDLITPSFAVVILVVIAEVFREGARLRRESELTV